MFNVFMLLNIIQQCFCQSLNCFDQRNTIKSRNFIFNTNDYLGNGDYFMYGLWSKYNPFSVYDFQLTDNSITNCYNLNNALELNTRKSNFLYYDCLDLEQKTIKKIVQFVDENEEQYNFIHDLDTYQYENIWYYFGISLLINKKKFELLIMQNLNILFYSNFNFPFPFYDQHLIITFGGGLYLNDQQRVTTLNQNQQFSSFPGKLCFSTISQSIDFLGQDIQQLAVQEYQLLFVLSLPDQNNLKTQFIDQTLKYMNTDTKTSINEISDSFSIDGWIKGIKIQQIDQKFLYKFMKISADSESEQIINDNLCPFQLLYRIQNSKLYLQILTYSYTYPSLNLDFSNNPFLIQQEFELQLQQIYQWHYLSVRLQENQLTTQITFYERESQYQLNFNTEVKQFHNMRFKISIGNLFQNKNNYIEMKIFALTLISEWTLQQQKQCHLSCKTCEGPTQNDCLNCEQTSLRFYIPETQSCVCPEHLLDHTDGTCKDYKNLQFSLVEQKRPQPQCQYGYFKYDESTCVQCPSNPNSNTIFCLNCLQNPLTWKSNPVCETLFLYNESDTLTYQKFNEYDALIQYTHILLYYQYDNENIQFCKDCYENNIIDFEHIIKRDNQQIFHFQESLCGYYDKNQRQCKYCEQCFDCNLEGCVKCQRILNQIICLQCGAEFFEINGQCVLLYQITSDCQIPYYKNFQQICKLCNLENCLYCFEYLKNDLSKNTLFNNYDSFVNDEFYQLGLGCALCQEGYQFNFIIGKCIFEEPKIINCKRSYINLEGVEVCTLADSQSFDVAPEIINCQWKIKNCYSCIKTPSQGIKCIVCEDGYSTNLFSGQCQLCSIQYAKKCIVGNVNEYDGWMQLLQSFIMQFLNKKQFYPNPNFLKSIYDTVISCEDGYKPNFQSFACLKYCNSDCLKCIESQKIPYGFICVDCPLNYYNQPSRSNDQRICIVCPKLCSICESRTPEEIYQLNPYFIITQDNVKFTHKCIQKIQRNDVQIDSEFQIAKLIFDENNKVLNFDVGLILYLMTNSYEYLYFNSINYQYCNQIGVDIIQINFQLELKLNFIQPRAFEKIQAYNMISNTLKQNIFSLKLIILNLIGQKQQLNQFINHFITNSFDYINIIKIDFFLINPNYFIFYNNLPTYLTIKNCTFQNNQTQTFGVFNINITYSKFIELNNLTFQNLYLIDSIIFNISGEYLESDVIILDIILQNCEFVNSTLISVFHNQYQILIQNLRIVNSTFNNSNLIDFNSKNTFSKIGNIKNIQFLNNIFFNCDIIKIQNFQQLIMSNVLISNNYFNTSIFFTTNSNFQIDSLVVELNIFKNSTFFKSSNEFYQNQILFFFKNLGLKQNKFSNLQLFSISTQYQQNLKVIFNDLLIENNQIDASLTTQSFLFQIHCNEIQFYNIKILQLFNIQIIYIYDTQSIQIQKLDFINLADDIQIPIGQDCINNFKLLQVIQVFGFETIILEDVYINSLHVQDSSIFQFTSNIQFNTDSIEKIQMKNIIFQDNILLKFNIGKRISLIYIYSEKIQTISFDQINFHSNLLHQTANDLSENVAGLIYINSQMSETKITNLVSTNNGITNSSCSFLYFTTYSLFIQNYQIDGLNTFNNQLFKRYIQNTEYFNQYTKQEIQLIIQKLVSIQTKGTACYATVTWLEIKDSRFQNILSSSSPLFEINTEGQGFIKFENLMIRNVDVIYDSNLELQGSIKINSQNSQLNLNFINLIFDQVLNKFSSSILSLTPSQRKNQIFFKDIQILNSISLLNQIIKAEFSEIVKEFNFVYFQNVSILQTEQAWYNYFQKIGQINSEDLQKIMNDNAIINVVSCTLIIENLFVEGIIQSPVIKISNAVNFKITYCKFFSIQTFYQLNIIQIVQNKFSSMKIKMGNNQFRNLQLYQPINEQMIQKKQLDKQIIDNNCQFDNTNFMFQQKSFYMVDILRLMQSQQNSGSLINIQSLSNQTNVLIQSLQIIENNCNFCQEGIISINIKQIQKLKIKELICIKNQIIKFGCLNILSSNDYENQVKLSDSIFALNLGQSGVGITFINIKGFVYRTLIFNNSAVEMAGGLEIKVLENKFQLINTLIFQNQAQQCGGIQLSSYSNLQKENFIQSVSLFNKADKLANNIVEAPTQLALKINNQLMKHQIEINDKITYSILEMSAQKVIQQNIVFYTNHLTIPSNQKIVEYKIFELKTLQFIPYIKEFSLYFLNSQIEQLGNLEDQNCTVFQNIIQQNGALINKSELFLVSFDTKQSKIDLGHLYFTFDPYESSKYIQEIQIVCNISENKILSYKLKTKSFYCQLGEFYTNSGCQICDSKYGFYSVSYNASKCSIFDKTKFSEITSNQISLLPGFWRPDFLSDYTEICYQKQKNCLGGWSVGDSSCLQGNLGGLCYECDFYNVRGNGYYFRNLDNDECSLCDDSNNYLMYFVIVSLIAMISIFMTLRSIEKTNQLFNNLKIGKKFGKIIFKLDQDHEGFLIKMFVNYLWIFSLIFTYNINFSINLNIVDQASNTSYSMANNLDCFLSQIQEINLVYIRLVATILFIFIQFILVYVIFVLISKIQKSKFDFSNLSNTSLYLYISNNAALTKQFCSLIAKKTISNIDFVQGSMALKFDSITHNNWIYAFILPGLSINGCFIPFLLIGILYLKRKQLDQIKIRKYFCYLFNEYNEANYYWEQIKIWQKTILIIIMVYFEGRYFLKTILFGLTLIIYQFLAYYYKPYVILSLNKLDYQAGLLCCIAIFFAAARNESYSTTSVEVSNILQITIALLCIFLIYLYINILIKAYYKKYKLAVLQTLLTITKKLWLQTRLTENLSKIVLTEKNRRDRLLINFQKLKKYLIKVYKLNSQFKQNQTDLSDQTFIFFSNKSMNCKIYQKRKSDLL